MIENSLFFCIPRLIVQVKGVIQSMKQSVLEIPDGPCIVLICQTPEQMLIINEKILRGRKAELYVNIDLKTTPASFAVFMDVIAKDGIDLSVNEMDSLMTMMDPTFRTNTYADNFQTGRIMFGNGVDLKGDELSLLIEGKKKFGKFNFMVGHNMPGNQAMFSVPMGRQPIFVEYDGSYTTMQYDDYVEDCLKRFAKK